MTGMRTLALILFAQLLALAPFPRAAGAAETPPERTSLVTVEGEVLELAEVTGEGGLQVVAATLSRGGDDEKESRTQILLGPSAVLEETGFEVEEGDRLRARIFTGGEGPARAQKVRNLSRDTMLRFRTLHQLPIWDGHGRWQGGPGMHHGRSGGHGPGGGGHR